MNNDLQNRYATEPARRMPPVALAVGAGLLVACGALASALFLRDPTPGPNATTEAATTVASTTTQTTVTKPRVSTPVVKTAQVCGHCGVVESVRQVQVKGDGTGVGAVAGGVLGGVVGNQMGGGNGKTAMTVLGAVGGGFAGNEVEKRARSQTLQEVHIRMDDGSSRTLTMAQAPVGRGDRVSVDGQQIRRL